MSLVDRPISLHNFAWLSQLLMPLAFIQGNLVVQDVDVSMYYHISVRKLEILRHHGGICCHRWMSAIIMSGPLFSVGHMLDGMTLKQLLLVKKSNISCFWSIAGPATKSLGTDDVGEW